MNSFKYRSSLIDIMISEIDRNSVPGLYMSFLAGSVAVGKSLTDQPLFKELGYVKGTLVHLGTGVGTTTGAIIWGTLGMVTLGVLGLKLGARAAEPFGRELAGKQAGAAVGVFLGCLVGVTFGAIRGYNNAQETVDDIVTINKPYSQAQPATETSSPVRVITRGAAPLVTVVKL